ncbi:hypothetical protein AM218_15355 [Hymenobacter sp. DG25A]|nr:hypothetical protein AM218_15355 [Hymenobacter sp. DG25A]
MQAPTTFQVLPVHRSKRLNTINSQKKPVHAASPKGDFFQILGTIVFIGGIVLWVVMGGWAGFGLFAFCSLAALILSFWGSYMIDGNLP